MSLEARDKNGETALHRAAAFGDSEVIQRLVDEGADLSAVNSKGQTPLLVSTSFNRKEAFQILLERGSNVQVADKDGNTAQHFAVRELSVLIQIIRKGADVNATNAHGCTPLHQAAHHSFSAAVISLLLENGSNVHCQGKSGNTPSRSHYTRKRTDR